MLITNTKMLRNRPVNQKVKGHTCWGCVFMVLIYWIVQSTLMNVLGMKFHIKINVLGEVGSCNWHDAQLYKRLGSIYIFFFSRCWK